MKIVKNKRETIIKSDEKGISDFFLEFKEKYTTFNNDNIIIDFSELKGTNTEKILLFLQHSKTHKGNGLSFVIVAKAIDTDSLLEEIMVVPTLTEAQDIIEMEEIERDLGF